MAVAKCPCCAGETFARVRFTLWGGALGPALLSLVRCAACGVQYHGKKGTRVEKSIRLYTCVMFGLLIMLAACVFYAYAGSPATPGII
jgi:hypothetical protein